MTRNLLWLISGGLMAVGAVGALIAVTLRSPQRSELFWKWRVWLHSHPLVFVAFLGIYVASFPFDLIGAVTKGGRHVGYAVGPLVDVVGIFVLVRVWLWREPTQVANGHGR